MTVAFWLSQFKLKCFLFSNLHHHYKTVPEPKIDVQGKIETDEVKNEDTPLVKVCDWDSKEWIETKNTETKDTEPISEPTTTPEVSIQTTEQPKNTDSSPNTGEIPVRPNRLSIDVSKGDFFEEWNEITPQIHIRKFEEITA